MSRMVDVDNGIKGSYPKNTKSSSNNESSDIIRSLNQKNQAREGKSLKENQSERDQYSPKQAIKLSKTKHSKPKAESLITPSLSPFNESTYKEYSKKKKSKKKKTTNIVTGTSWNKVRDRKLLKLTQKLMKLQIDSPEYKIYEEKIKKLELEILAGDIEFETTKSFPPLESTSSRSYESSTPQRLQQQQNNMTPTIIVESTVSSSSSSVTSCSKKTILSSPTPLQIEAIDQDNTFHHNKNVERTDIAKEASRKKRSSNYIEDLNKEESYLESNIKKDNLHNPEKKRRKTNKVVGGNSSTATEINVKADATRTISRQSQTKNKQITNDDLLNAINPAKSYRWRTHQITEDYVTLVGNIMYPNIYISNFGYDPLNNQYPLERATTLGFLTHPIRRPTVVEKWSPYEIAMFEAALCIHGKQFHVVQKLVKTKNTKEIVEFYYVWKKTSHYKEWKKQYEGDIDSSDEDDNDSDLPNENEKK